MLTLWIFVFIASLVLLVKGADWLLGSAEKIGLAIGLSPFIVGVVIVGLGTSFPEMISAMVAVFEGVTEIVAANAVGSNIANILLIVGVSAIFARELAVTKSLIDLDLPLLAVSTLLFVGVAYDGSIVFVEALLLLVTYVVYLLYTIIHEEKDDVRSEYVTVLPSRSKRRRESMEKTGISFEIGKIKEISWKEWTFLVVGVVALGFGAKYLVDSVVALSELTGIGEGAITLAAVALGTSLPELLVSIKAALKKQSEVALGNIFGSNVFNLMVVVGIPGLISDLTIDTQTLALGLPVLIAATFVFIVSGISRRIHLWEGAMFVIGYIFFIGKLFGLF